MATIWTHALLSVAEMSSILSAATVIICFICIVLFIFRFQDFQFTSTSVVHTNISPVQVNLQKIEVPFMCCLPCFKDLPSSEIHVKIKSNISFCFYAFWGVNADWLKNALYLPWKDFVQHMEEDSLLKANKTESLGNFNLECSDKPHCMKFIIDPSLPPLGKPPRSHFPLVLLIRDFKENQDDNNVGALITIIHISDVDCPMPTAILYHYLKQYSGQVTQLQNLYTQRTDPDLSTATNSQLKEDIEEEGPCVICKVLQPTRALLPCRHVCICAVCFPLLERCPMCRCRISAFFLTDAKEEERQLKENKSTEEPANLQRHQSFLNNMNRALNSFLGIN